MSNDRQHLLTSLTEFHQIFEVPSFSSLDRQHRLALVSLRATLIEEELLEVIAANEDFLSRPRDEKRTHLAKEIADLTYVTVGTAEVLHLPLADPHVDPDKIRAYPFSQLTPVLKERVHDVIEDLISLMRLLFADDADERDLTDLIDGIAPLLQSLVDHIAVLAFCYRIPLQAVFDAVHASNLSKANPATGRVERREDGKVLKGRWYREPDLEWLTLAFHAHPGLQMEVDSVKGMAA